jgi:hypothetical protein
MIATISAFVIESLVSSTSLPTRPCQLGRKAESITT